MKTRKIINYIVSWLNNYLKKSNKKGFIVGISGGIDSAITSVLIAKTGFSILILEMPIYQNINEIKRSKENINFLKKNFSNIKTLSIDLSPIFNTFCEVLKIEEYKNVELSLVNVKSRLRMITLYYYASINNYLVVGTGNKIEDFGVGFFTKYGDGGVDINPIGDLYKSEIISIGKKLNIPLSIQNAEPTDGLWKDNRSDKDQLGYSYEDLEWAMNIVEKGDYSKIINKDKRILIEKYLKLNKKNKHKILQIPICKIPKYLRYS